MTVSYENMSTPCSTMPNAFRFAASTVPGHATREASLTRVTELLS
jgi:hypothetical protein